MFSLERMRFAGVRLLSVLLACVSCAVGCGPRPTYPPENTQVVVLLSRDRKTGRFDAFEIRDKAMIERLKSAMNQDLCGPDPFDGGSVGLLVCHLLAFRSASGDIVVYNILGDTAIVSNSSHRSAGNTLAALKVARFQGEAVAISRKRMGSLVPDFRGLEP